MKMLDKIEQSGRSTWRGPLCLSEHSMPLFKGRSSLLEVQNRALIKTAKERAQRIEELECELQILRARAEQANNKVKRPTGLFVAPVSG